MDQIINLDTWKRRQHFNFFKAFTEPFHGVTVDLDMTQCVDTASRQGYSLTSYYMFQFIKTIQQEESFRLRIRGEEVHLLDIVHLGTTVLKPDETFNYILVEYNPNFVIFDQAFRTAIVEGKARIDMFPPGEDTDRQIHTSILPWTAFTGLSHARRMNHQDSVPKVSFGRMRLEADRVKMPLAIHVHHALVDGIHVGRFIEKFQENLNS